MSVKTEQLNTAIWVYDIDQSKIVWANTAALKLWNSSSNDELLSRDFKTGQSEVIKESLLNYKLAFKRGEVIEENWSLNPKGQEVQAFCQLSGFELEDGRIAMLVEATTSELMTSNPEIGGVAILSIYRTDGKLINGSIRFTKIFGNKLSHLNEMFCHHDVLEKLFAATLQNIKFEDDVLLNTLNGEQWFKIEASKTTQEDGNKAILFHLSDIHERKTVEQTLRQQAWEDSLTGLVNRRGLTHFVEENINNKIPFTLLYVDLDGFKMINDSLGHAKGDEVLIEVSQRLKINMKESDIICRFGGDEFILLIEHALDDDCAFIRCETIIDSFTETYENAHGRDLTLSASIGVATYPSDASNFEHIIACADAAMYHAKKLGKKRWVSYENGMEHVSKRISVISQQLSFAIQKQEFSLYYQPIINMKTGHICSFEVLLRWKNDELGLLSTEETIQIAEQTGLIDEIENWVLVQALHDLVILKKVISEDVGMAINISGLHLSDPTLVDTILQQLKEHKLQPQDISIELTERVLFTDKNNENSSIRRLVDNEIKISIDDFGTGFSSLAYLYNIPATTVKVDKSFLESIATNTVILECIHRLVTALDMESLIEGIETEEQAKILFSLGFNIQQGYFHGRPKPIEYYLHTYPL